MSELAASRVLGTSVATGAALTTIPNPVSGVRGAGGAEIDRGLHPDRDCHGLRRGRCGTFRRGNTVPHRPVGRVLGVPRPRPDHARGAVRRRLRAAGVRCRWTPCAGHGRRLRSRRSGTSSGRSPCPGPLSRASAGTGRAWARPSCWSERWSSAWARPCSRGPRRPRGRRRPLDNTGSARVAPGAHRVAAACPTSRLVARPRRYRTSAGSGLGPRSLIERR